MRVKMYGSPTFTPTDLPSDVTLERANFDANYGGTVGDYGAYWTTNATWSDGWYCRSNFDSATFGACPGEAQDGTANSGWEWFRNQVKEKQLLFRVGSDLPSGAIISYVRVWLRFYNSGGGTGSFWMRPFYRVIGNGSTVTAGPFGYWGVVPVGSSTSNQYFRAREHTLAQYSTKLTQCPVPSGVWTKDVLYNTGWGVRGIQGSLGPWAQVGEFGVEVGFDFSPFEVVTGTAAASATSATVYGSIDPKGDTSNWWFQYGVDPSTMADTAVFAGPTTTPYNVQLTINGLTTETLYYYRLVANDSDGVTHYGATKTFFTVSMCSTRAMLVM